MNYLIVILIFCFFLFLYLLYYLSKDDFVIIRRDVPMNKIFDGAFLVSIVALFSSRLFYVLFNPNPVFLNPVEFLAFPYFPGLSLIGGIIGGSIFLYFYSRIKKMPIGKMLDLFIMSFILVLPIGFLGTFLVLWGKTNLFFNINFAISLVIFIIFSKIFYPFSSKGEIKDGSLSLLFLTIFSSFYFLLRLFYFLNKFSFFDLENITLLVVLFSSLIILLNQEVMDKFLSHK